MSAGYAAHLEHWPWRQERVGIETDLVVCGCNTVLYQGEVPDGPAEATAMAIMLDALAEAAQSWMTEHSPDRTISLDPES